MKLIKKLKPNQVFVFGSNLNGDHAVGAAKTSFEKFGAVMGQGEGLQGKSYAFPTLDRDFQKLPRVALEASRDRLFKTCKVNSTLQFFLSPVGTGIAGYSVEEMSSLFMYDTPANLVLPDGWPRRLFKFLNEGMKSAHGDCKWQVNRWKKSYKPVRCCEAGGYHASARILDALNYVTGVHLAEVEVKGRFDFRNDKQCWSEMKIVKVKDWTKTDSVSLAIFSAEQVIRIYVKKYPTDDRPRKAIEAAKHYLSFPTDQTVHAAHVAANAAYADANSAYAAAHAADDINAKIESYLRDRFKA